MCLLEEFYKVFRECKYKWLDFLGGGVVFYILGASRVCEYELMEL